MAVSCCPSTTSQQQPGRRTTDGEPGSGKRGATSSRQPIWPAWRARDYCLLHGNSQKLLQMVQLLLRLVLPEPWQDQQCLRQSKPPILCPHCGGVMAIIAVRVREINPAPA
jgi:hypothetical protein